jgi:UDP-GlcNAc3NAcA epimerase
MPEEINRVLTDHVSQLLFCPAQKAVDNLKLEGVSSGVHVVGDVMYDAVLRHSDSAEKKSSILSSLDLKPKQYILATVHRASNVDDTGKLLNILETFSMLGETVVFPVHPRTRKAIQTAGVSLGANIKLVEPVGYLDMLWLEKNARMILTDSGGVQKEAYWFATPCVTLREETEWVETVESGWNVVVGVERERIMNAIRNFSIPTSRPNLFGDGDAAQKIVRLLENERK